MYKLDHVILITAMNVVGKLSETDIQCKDTIESFSFQFPKMPESVKTAAEFNEYVESKVIPGFHTNIIGRFTALATRHLEKNIYPHVIPAEEVAKIKTIFEDKISEINATLLDSTSKDLKYFNCDLDWLTTVDEKFSCSYYLRSSLSSCVKVIFNDIFDMITKCKDVEDKKKDDTQTPVVRKQWNADPDKHNEDAKPAAESTEEKKPEEKTVRRLSSFISRIAGNEDKEPDPQPTIKDEEKSDNVQHKSDTASTPAPTETPSKPVRKFTSIMPGRQESTVKKDSEPSKTEPEKSSTANKEVETPADVKGTTEQPKAEESNIPEQVKPEDVPDVNFGKIAPEIKLQIPTPPEIQDMIQKPTNMVEFESNLIVPQYPENEMINKHFVIGAHVLISPVFYEEFETALTTIAEWIEKYDAEHAAKKPTMFGVFSMHDVNNFRLARLQNIGGRLVFMMPDHKNYMIIDSANGVFTYWTKDETNKIEVAGAEEEPVLAK